MIISSIVDGDLLQTTRSVTTSHDVCHAVHRASQAVAANYRWYFESLETQRLDRKSVNRRATSRGEETSTVALPREAHVQILVNCFIATRRPRCWRRTATEQLTACTSGSGEPSRFSRGWQWPAGRRPRQVVKKRVEVTCETSLQGEVRHKFARNVRTWRIFEGTEEKWTIQAQKRRGQLETGDKFQLILKLCATEMGARYAQRRIQSVRSKLVTQELASGFGSVRFWEKHLCVFMRGSWDLPFNRLDKNDPSRRFQIKRRRWSTAAARRQQLRWGAAGEWRATFW